MGLSADLGGTFLLGLVTPLTAVCVLPLYLGFLAYLSHQAGNTRNRLPIPVLGLLVVGGVVVFIVAGGLVSSTLLEVFLTGMIGIISPIAFGILGGIRMLLLLDVNVSQDLPSI